MQKKKNASKSQLNMVPYSMYYALAHKHIFGLYEQRTQVKLKSRADKKKNSWSHVGKKHIICYFGHISIDIRYKYKIIMHGTAKKTTSARLY